MTKPTIDNNAKRYKIGEDAVADKIAEVLVNFLFNRPFYGNFALNFPYILCGDQDGNDWCKTIATDGRNLFLNRDFIKSLKRSHIEFGIGHLLNHLILEHLQHVGTRDRDLWHAANDYIANANLIQDNIGEAIDGALISNEYTYKMTSDEVYKDLVQKKATPPENFDQHLPFAGDGADDDGLPTMDGSKLGDIQANILRSLISASQAAGSDSTPAMVRRMLDDLTNPKMDWRSYINAFLRSADTFDYDYTVMSRYELDDGLIEPGIVDDHLVHVDVAVDLSGSMSMEMQREIMSEVKGIMMTFPRFKLRCFSFDTSVHSVKEFTEANINEIDYYAATMEGGGGTDFDVVWNHLKEKDIKPDRLLVFTDGYPWGSWGDPEYCSTLFIIHGNPSRSIVAPFGETAHYE